LTPDEAPEALRCVEMPVSVIAERRWSVTAPVSLDGISGSATWSTGGVVGATPIDVAAERGARVIIDVNPLVPIPQTWSPLKS